MFLTLILLFCTLATTATDLYLPSLPAIGYDLSADATIVQLSVSFYLIALSISQLIYGPCSDRFGRKPMAILGLLVSLVGTVVSMFAFNIGTLILGRIIQGSGLGAGPLFRPILRDVYSGAELARIGSILTVATACMMAAAPTLGGYIERYLGWRFDFVFLSAWILLVLIGITVWLPETNRYKDPKALKPHRILENLWLIFHSRRFIGYVGCTSVGYGGLMAYFTASPFLIQTTIGVGPVLYGWLALILAGGLALGGLLSHKLVRKLGTGNMVKGSLSLMLLAAIIMLLLGIGWTNLWTLMPTIFVFSIGLGSLFPNTYAEAMGPFGKLAGTAAALYGGLQILGAFVASTIASILSESTQRPLAWILVSLTLLGFVFERWAHSRSTNVKPMV